MTLNRVEHALGMMRIYLVEYATQNDWGDARSEELARTIAACIRQTTDGASQKAQERSPRLTRDALRCAIRFVHDNLDSKLKWDDIATAVGLDPFTFGRSFKLTAGITPHQYIIRCRLRRAMRLLAHDELTLADIALEVGCSCQSHLTTLFRKHLGTTPGAFRDAATEHERRTPRFGTPKALSASERTMTQAG
jgi:AraC family transcriptional regulator